MAIEAFELDGYRIETVVLDHTVGGVHDPQQGAADMTALVQDPEVVAVVGPFNSSVAKAQVPVSNEAGLLQCSPANTNPDVTKGAPGLELRAAYPDRISYIRVSTTDDFQGDAVAEFAFNTLGLRRVAIIDDGETYGHGTAVAFAAAWERLGGVVVGSETIRAGSPGHAKALKGMAAATPDAVFFGGLTSTGGVETRLGMVATGLGDLPLLSVDGIQDGPASAEGSFINLAGDAAANTYSSVAAIGEIPGQADFQAAYMKRYGTRPGAYSAPAHACAEVILAAIRAAAERGEVTREAVRAAATDTAATFDTVIGPVRFDAVGDITTKTVSIYRVDTGSDGVADWFYQAQVAIEPR